MGIGTGEIQVLSQRGSPFALREHVIVNARRFGGISDRENFGSLKITVLWYPFFMTCSRLSIKNGRHTERVPAFEITVSKQSRSEMNY